MERLYGYYLQKNVNIALKLHNGIIDETDKLASQPYIAAVEPAIKKPSKTYRSLVVSKGNYKVIYFVESEKVIIARVWGCRQNPKKLKLT